MTDKQTETADKSALDEFTRVMEEKDELKKQLEEKNKEVNEFKEKDEQSRVARIKELAESIAQVTKGQASDYLEMDEEILKKILEDYKKIASISESAKSKGRVTESSAVSGDIETKETLDVQQYDKNGDLTFREEIVMESLGFGDGGIPETMRVKVGE